MAKITTNKEKIGEGFKMHDSSLITCDELIIGRNVIIDERVKLICHNGSINIGDNTYIGNDVTIVLKSFQIGEYCKLHNHCLINGKDSVIIGDNCWFGQNTVMNGEALLKIGNNVGIGTYSSIWTHGYFGQLIDGCQIFSIKPTIIEDDVWLIGSYNTIFPGVTIGKQAVLMGTSVVTKSLLAGRIFAGNPAKDITDKIGEPYKQITFSEKVNIIKKYLINYLDINKLNFKQTEFSVEIEQYGNVFFYNQGHNFNIDRESVIFYEKVDDWSENESFSKFCLTSKTYQKHYTSIEILVKTILNPVAARFVAIKQ